jgi:hypothetical protein
MKKRTEKTVKQADPELTTSKKLDQIKTGAKIKRQTGGTEKKETIIGGKNGAKTVVHETEEKFEETAVLRKKRNYVMYESKLGTEKNTEITQIAAPKPTPKPKPKPVREPSPRVEEKIVITKKKKEYLDNYQYKETKVLKNPRKASVVTHQRLGDIVGGVYEEHTFQRMTVNDTGRGPKLYSEQTTTSTSRRGPQGQQLKSTQRTITASRTVPAQSREYRKEIRQNAGNTNNRNATEMRSNKTITTTTKMTTRSNSRPANARGTTSTNTTTTTTSKTVTRGRSTGGLRGKQ